MIFKENASKKFYEADYFKGATEYQDETPFKYDPDMIECIEVEKVKVIKEMWQHKE